MLDKAAEMGRAELVNGLDRGSKGLDELAQNALDFSRMPSIFLVECRAGGKVVLNCIVFSADHVRILSSQLRSPYAVSAKALSADDKIALYTKVVSERKSPRYCLRV
jgi:hypothetical protein